MPSKRRRGMLCSLRVDQPESITGDRLRCEESRDRLEDGALLGSGGGSCSAAAQFIALVCDQALGAAGVAVALAAPLAPSLLESETPSSSASCSSGVPARISSTAWRRNSGGCGGRVLGMWTSVPPEPGGAKRSSVHGIDSTPSQFAAAGRLSNSARSWYEKFCEASECRTTLQLEDFVRALTRPAYT
jgi:hypothetical protein